MAETRIKSSGLSANITVGNLSLTGTTSVTGNIVPTSNNVVNLGSPTFRFGSLYLSGNTIDLGGTQITTTTTGDLSFNTSSGNVAITANTVNFLSTVANTTTTTGNVAFTANLTAQAVYADRYFYSNGTAYYNTGYTGSAGTAGSAGVTGYTGSAGTAGSAGSAGYTGSAGTAGTTGYTGSIGTVGYTGSAGTTGNVGYTGSSGTAGVNATGVNTFVATGVIASGKTVALNSDGTVSIVQQADTPLSIGSTTTLPSINAVTGSSSARGDSYMSMLYNSTDNVVYVVYKSSYNGRITIELGTISGSTITFSGFYQESSATNYGSFLSAHWNSTTNTILIISSGNQYAYGIVVTPTAGPGVTWPANWTQIINNSSLLSSRLTYHPGQSKYLLSYVLGYTGTTNTIYGMVLTVSGTTISSGSQTQIATSGNNLYFNATYDATNSQTIIAYAYGGGSVIPVTVSSTTLTPGSATQFTADQSYSAPAIAYNSTNNNLVIVYTDGSDRYQAIAATKSGSTFTFGSKVLIDSPNNNNGAFFITYDGTAGRYLFIYNSGSTGSYLRDLSVSGTTVTAGPTTALNSNLWEVSAVYVASLGKVLFSYGVYSGSRYAAAATGVVVGATNAGSWIGISSNSATNGGAVSVTTLGGINTAITGLTINTPYYLTATGNLSATATSYSKVGIATAANKILITNAAVTGYTGSTGTTGNVGYTGSAGTAGSAGSTGYTGSIGTAGYTGSIGYTGSAGSAGTTGYTGSVGTTGYTGSIGTAGNVGYTGSRGTTAVTSGNTAPVSPSFGDMWYYTPSDVLLRYLNVGTMSAWIDISGPQNNFGASAVTQAAIAAFVTAPPTVEYLVVAGGGGAAGASANGGAGGGGGGAGRLKTATGFAVSPGVALTVTVGAGGAGGYNSGYTEGNDSVFSTVSAYRGGRGGGALGLQGGMGGSGGGGIGYNGGGVAYSGGGGDAGFGNDGGPGSYSNGENGGGGGGAGSGGAGASTNGGGNGGAGMASSITGTSVYYAGGGGGGQPNAGKSAGTGGIGGGGDGSSVANATATSGTANTGGGGGGAYGGTGGSGGSGIVVLRYADTYGLAASTTGSPTITTAGGYRIYKWTSSGSITF